MGRRLVTTMRAKKGEPAKFGANADQVGGEHYKSKFEHWDMVEETGMGYLEANATRYVVRWRKKNGLQDLEKALHYTQKLLEVVVASKGTHRNNKAMPLKSIDAKILLLGATFCKDNALTRTETDIVLRLLCWKTSENIQDAIGLIAGLIDGVTGTPLVRRDIQGDDYAFGMK